MSSLSPAMLKYLGAALVAAPGSEHTGLDGMPAGPVPDQGAAPAATQDPGTPAPVSPDGLTTAYAEAADKSAREGVAAGRKVKDAVKVLDVAQTKGEGAIQEEAAYNEKVEAAQRTTFDDALANIGKFDEHFATTMMDVREKTQQAYDSYLKATDDYKTTHVYGWWSQAATGAKVAGLISQLFAGALQGLTGQLGAPTPLDKIIDQDLQLQRMNLAQKGEVAGNARGLYNDLKAQFKDEVVVEGAMREIAYNSTIERLKSVAGSMGGAAKAKADKEIAALTEKIAQIKSDTLVHVANVTQNGSLQAAGIYENLAGLWGQRATAEAKAEHQEPKAAISGIAGSEFLSPEQRTQLADKKTAASSLLNLTKQLQDLIQSKGSMPLNDYVNQKQQLVNQMVLAKKDVDKLGAISENDMRLALGALGVSGGFGDAMKRFSGLDNDKDQMARLAKFYISTKAGWGKTVGSFAVTKDGQQYKLRDAEGLGE